MSIFEQAEKYFFNVYKRFAIDVEKGLGAYLIDKNGNKYLDFLAGIAVNALGYNHPQVISSIKVQLDRNLHLSNYFVQDIQVQLAEKLLQLTPFSKVFFSNSGTEAIEGLLKAVKKWGNENNKHEIIAFQGSFHGRTLGALSITMQDKYQKSFKPLLENIRVVPFNDVKAFKETVSLKTAAVFFEGITGEGGVKPVSKEMIEAFKEAREQFGTLLITDEIQTGVGRTGSFYYFEQMDLIPDAIASAKGLGGGLPLGAFLAGERLQEIFNKGEHGTTYGGNPLACAAGLSTIEIIASENFLNQVNENGNYFRSKLNEIASDFSPFVEDVRGQGMMVGMQVKNDAPALMDEGFKNGLLFNIAGGNTLRFVPPLIVSKTEIDEAAEKIRKTFNSLYR